MLLISYDDVLFVSPYDYWIHVLEGTGHKASSAKTYGSWPEIFKTAYREEQTSNVSC